MTRMDHEPRSTAPEAHAPTTTPAFTLGDLFDAVLRHRWLVLLCALATAVLLGELYFRFWYDTTDGVGVPVPREGSGIDVPESKRWIAAGVFHHPAMFGIGPGIEHNTHKIGECVDTREIAPVIAFYARFPSVYRSES